jgi:hypothetical protein
MNTDFFSVDCCRDVTHIDPLETKVDVFLNALADFRYSKMLRMSTQ